MNSIFKKISTSFALLALSFGIGLTSRGISVVKAEEAGPDASGWYSDAFTTGTYTGEGATGVITWLIAEDNISMSQNKGSGSNVGSSYNSSARMYIGHYLHFKAINGYQIKKVEITYSTTNKGDILNAGTVITENVVTNDEATINKTLGTESGGTHTFTINGDVSEFYIQNIKAESSSSNVQLRWGSGGVKVYYTKPAASGEITSVTVKAPDNTTGEYTVTTGYIGRKTVQLSAEVVKTGTLSTAVIWSSCDTTAMSVSNDGLVKILKASPEGVVVTATSKADLTKAGTITIKTSISAFPGMNDVAEFTTATYGSSDQTTSVKDESLNLTGDLEYVKLYVTQRGTSKAGYFASDNILKAYISDELSFSSQKYRICWIDFETKTGYPLNASTATVNAGEFLSYEETTSTLDLFGVETTSVDIKLKAQVRISKITLGVVARTLTKVEIDTSGAGELSFAKDSVFNAVTALTNSIKAIATYDDGGTMDVTLESMWSLDTSTVGTASLTVTYEGKTSAPVSVIIVDSSIMVTDITITPNTDVMVYAGQSKQFTESVMPTNATEKGVIWSVSPSSLGTIDEEGLFTAGEGAGTATITASAKDGSGVTASVTVTISHYPYEVATSVNGGDQVIIVNKDNNKVLSGISTTTTKYGIASDYTDGFAPTSYVFTLVAGTIDGSFAFKQGNKYLTWTKDNSLNQVDSITANSSWTISFDTDNIATITNVADTTRIIKFNSDRFATYANTNPIQVSLLKLKGASGEEDAIIFGARFLNGFSAICTNNNTTDTAMLKAKWNELETLYASQSSEVKAYIAMKSADEASMNNIEKMLALYNYIYHKYGTSLSLSNWLGRKEATKMSNSRIEVIDSNHTALLIASLVITSLSVVSLLGFMIIKKRKED